MGREEGGMIRSFFAGVLVGAVVTWRYQDRLRTAVDEFTAPVRQRWAGRLDAAIERLEALRSLVEPPVKPPAPG
jgi:hypothetical protein